MTKEHIRIVPSLVDASEHLKLVSFFLLFQDIANKNTESLGGGKEATTDKGLDWIVARISLDIKRMPMLDEEYELETYPFGVKAGCIFYRCARMLDKNNDPIIRLNSMWSVMDNKTRKIVLKPNISHAKEEYGDELAEPVKVALEDANFTFSKVVRYSDCDLNGHLNNTRYVEALVDINNLEFYKKYFISHIDINFISEVHDEEKLDIYASDDKTYIEGRVGSRLSFTAKVTYKAH